MPRKKSEGDQSEGNVSIKITKFGAGKVSTGEHIAESGDVMAQQGDVLEVSEGVAKAMEAKGYGEIE